MYIVSCPQLTLLLHPAGEQGGDKQQRDDRDPPGQPSRDHLRHCRREVVAAAARVREVSHADGEQRGVARR